MNNIKNKIIKFMQGRYGIDDIYKDALFIYLILLILNIFLKSQIIHILQWIIFVVILYRSFSKQIKQRRKENDKYLKFKKKILKPFKNIKDYFKDKNHIYKKCHHCDTVLKLPIPTKRGIKHSTCPTCKKRNTYLILRKLKIEIIKNKKV